MTKGTELSSKYLRQMLDITEDQIQKIYWFFLRLSSFKDRFPGISYSVVDNKLLTRTDAGQLEICRFAYEQYFSYQ